MRREISWVEFAVAQAAFSSLWGACFVRAYNFFVYTRLAAAEEGSADAARDFSWSQTILICYFLSFAFGTAVIWLACRRRHPMLVLCASGAFVVAVCVAFAKAEAVIVFFPDLAPPLAVLASFVLAFVGLAVALLSKPHQEAPQVLEQVLEEHAVPRLPSLTW